MISLSAVMIVIIYDKNCTLSTMLTAMDQNLQKSWKGILPTITSPKCQRNAQ